MNKELYSHIFPNDVYSSNTIKESNIKNSFPLLYEKIKGINYKELLYCNLYEIEIPKCQNPNCNNHVNLKTFNIGFRKFCSNKCIAQFQKQDKTFKNKISKTKLNKSNHDLCLQYPNLNIEQQRNFFLIKNYCKHGDLKINKTQFNKLNKDNKCLCLDCNKEFIETYIPTDIEIIDFKNNFDSFYKKNSLAFKEDWFILYYPKYFKIIDYFSRHINNLSFQEKIYLFKNNLKEIPKCKLCNKETKFNHSQLHFNIFCEDHLAGYNSSGVEIELQEFIKTLNLNVEFNKRGLISKELDVYIPDKNIAIEFNGLYWHSDNFKDKFYHYNKWKECQDLNIQLLTIWEDDWNFKKDILKSIIKSKLKIYDKILYARKCTLKKVSYIDTKEFLNDNHLQGYSNSKIRLGLYYDNELVSLMTFGKSRFKENELELIRFCNKIDYLIIGGASKLFSAFNKNFNIDNNEITSYCSCDISNGDLYKKLEFEFIKHCGIDFWWSCGNKKESRFKYQKYKLLEEGFKGITADEIMINNKFYKIYGTGNLKFKYKKGL